MCISICFLFAVAFLAVRCCGLFQKEFGEELQQREVQVKPRGQPDGSESSSAKGRSILGENAQLVWVQ